jgi:hypothetical protein
MQYRQLILWSSIACVALGCLASPAAAAQTSPSSSAKLPGGERFSTVSDAAKHCPGDIVVWSTFSKKSRTFHLSSSKYYGKTKHGAYACEKDAVAAGYHASKR